jgi:lysophospholipase L1-like esterase
MKKTIIFVTALALVVLIAVGVLNLTQQNKALSVPNESEKMVSLGDSLTHGVGDESGEGFVENLEKQLKEEKNAIITVENHGIPDQQTDGLLQQVKKSKVKSDLHDADYVTLFIGTNDLIESNGGDLKEINEEKIAKGKADYERNLREILDIIREENKDVPILFLGLYNPYPDSQIIEAEIVEWNEKSQAIVDDYEKIKFISTNDLFHEKSTDYFSDSLHPNKKGYDLITKKILEEYDF